MDKDKKTSEYIDNINISNDASEAQRYDVVTPEEEAAVIRKLDYRLLPLVFVLYSLSVLDRSNLGNAKLAGLEDAINLSGTRYDWLGTLFYISCEPSCYDPNQSCGRCEIDAYSP